MTRIELSLTSDADSWYFYNTVTSTTSIKHFFTRHWYHWCNRKTLYCQNLYSLKLFIWNIKNFEIREFPCIIKTLIGQTVSTYDTSFFRSSNYWDGLKINVWWRHFNTSLKHVKYRNANTSRPYVSSNQMYDLFTHRYQRRDIQIRHLELNQNRDWSLNICYLLINCLLP